MYSFVGDEQIFVVSLFLENFLGKNLTFLVEENPPDTKQTDL